MAARDGDENISRYPSKWNRTEPIPIRQCGEDERRHTQMLYLQPQEEKDKINVSAEPT